MWTALTFTSEFLTAKLKDYNLLGCDAVELVDRHQYFKGT
jgi:hypothetical protein